MVKELVNKSEFARLAGVSPAAVTKACAGLLQQAVSGKRIDAAHPAAVQYLETHTGPGPQSPATGIDPRYEEAVEACRLKGRYTATVVRASLKIGHARAATIFKTMKAAGVVPAKGRAPAPPPPEETELKKPVLRGVVAKNEAKKRDRPRAPDDPLDRIPEDIRAFADMSLRDLVVQFGTDVAFVDWLKATKAIEDIHEKRLKNATTQGELVSRELVKQGVIGPIESAHLQLLRDGSKTIANRVAAMAVAGSSAGECEDFVVDQISSFLRPLKTKVARALR